MRVETKRGCRCVGSICCYHHVVAQEELVDHLIGITAGVEVLPVLSKAFYLICFGRFFWGGV